MRGRRCAGPVAAIAFALGAAAPAAAAPVSVDVERDSGLIAIRGLGNGPLRESAATGAGPGGRVGFRAAGEWHHATRLLRRSGDGSETNLRLATDDPLGRTIEVEARSRRAGLLALKARVAGGPADDVEAVGIGFEAGAAERYLGFGERSNAVDQRGKEVENYVGEGTYVDGDYPLFRTQVPPWGLRERADATYFPMPWLLSTRGYGVLLSNLETSRFRLAAEDASQWSVEVDARELALRVFAGPTPARAVRRLTEKIGRQPKPFAAWQLGPWVQTGHQNTEPGELSYLEILRAADAPVSAVETHMRYMPCGSDQGRETAEQARTAAFHAAGLAAVTYTREAICETYPAAFDRAVAANAFLRTPEGGPYTFPAFVGSGQTEIGMLDFSNPAAAEIYDSVLDRAYDNGYDGWMEDYGEYAPPDSVAANGMTGAQMHNYYPVLYHRAGFRYARSKKRPVVRFVRSGWTGVHPYAQIVWGGDPSTDWGFDGLRSAVIEALTMGLSGISSWGSDIGGFFTFSSPPLTEELLVRWVQFGLVSGVMRTKAEGIGIGQDSRPQVWEEPVLPIWRRYAKLRTQLYPYLVAADREYRRTGMPIMRHLALAHPDDRRAAGIEDEFMFGDDLLAAPVLEPGQTERSLYLPRGRWVDFWRSVSFEAGAGSFELGEARVLPGGGDVTVPAPVEELPLLVRAGALVPMLPAAVDTLSGYGAETPGVVRLRDRRRSLRLLAFPRGSSSAGLYGDGELRSREGAREWRLRIDTPRELWVSVVASLATLKRPFRPESVEIDGRPAEDWSYDRDRRVLELRLGPSAETLVVRGRP
jgi:alpha-glucosidase (family GH31 glycosyl hydrolase)